MDEWRTRGQLLRWRLWSCRLEPPQDSPPGPDVTGTAVTSWLGSHCPWACLSHQTLFHVPPCAPPFTSECLLCASGITPLLAVSRKHTFLDVAQPPAKIKRSRARSMSAPVAHVCSETERTFVSLST